MKVKDVMHKGVDWVSPDTPVTELAKLMREHDIGAIPPFGVWRSAVRMGQEHFGSSLKPHVMLLARR